MYSETSCDIWQRETGRTDRLAGCTTGKGGSFIFVRNYKIQIKVTTYNYQKSVQCTSNTLKYNNIFQFVMSY